MPHSHLQSFRLILPIIAMLKLARRLGVVPACEQNQISRLGVGGGGAGQNGFKTNIGCRKGVPNAHFASFCTTRQFLQGHYSISHWSSARTAKNWEFLLAFVSPLSLPCMQFFLVPV